MPTFRIVVEETTIIQRETLIEAASLEDAIDASAEQDWREWPLRTEQYTNSEVVEHLCKEEHGKEEV